VSVAESQLEPSVAIPRKAGAAGSSDAGMFGAPRPVKRLFQGKIYPLRAFLEFHGENFQRTGGLSFL
jgi:hypothetical protein